MTAEKFVFPSGTVDGIRKLMDIAAAPGTADLDSVDESVQRLEDEFQTSEEVAQRQAMKNLREAERREYVPSGNGFPSGDDDSFSTPYDPDDEDDVPDDTLFGTSSPATAFLIGDEPEDEELCPPDDKPANDPGDEENSGESGDDHDSDPEPDPGPELTYPPENIIPVDPDPVLSDPDPEHAAAPDPRSRFDPDAEVPWRIPSPPRVDTPDDVSGLAPATSSKNGAPDDETSDQTPPGDPGPSIWTRFREVTAKDRPMLKILIGIGISLGVVAWALGSHGINGPADKKPPAAATVPTVEPTESNNGDTPEPRILRPTGFGDPSKHRCAPPRSTDVRMAFTDDNRDVWKCRRAMGITHSVFEVDFGRPMVITDIHVVPGWDYIEPNGLDHWNEQRIVTRINWRIGQARPIPQTFDPSIRTGSTLHIPNIAAQKIVGTVSEDTAPPSSGGSDTDAPSGFGSTMNVDDYFAIGKIEIYGYPAGR